MENPLEGKKRELKQLACVNLLVNPSHDVCPIEYLTFKLNSYAVITSILHSDLLHEYGKSGMPLGTCTSVNSQH